MSRARMMAFGLLGLLVLAVVAAISYGIYNSITPWFWIYWLIIILALAALIVTSIRYELVGNLTGYVCGQLASNNNWRWVALAIVAVVFTISAILAGFGKPLLISSAIETKNVVMEQAERYTPGVRSEINYILWGERVKPTEVSEKKYSSWGHWVWAGILWLSVIIYLPIAFREEAEHALKEAIKIVEKRRKRETIVTGSATITPTTVAPKIYLKDSFMRLFSIDILAEYVPIFISKIMKRFVHII